MSTRSFIAEETGENKYRAVYCHNDGYLTYNGAMLLDHYDSAEAVKHLIDLGDVSFIAQRPDPDPLKPHGFDIGVCQCSGVRSTVIVQINLSGCPWVAACE